MTQEVWRGIKDWPAYEVSNLGRVRSVTRTITASRGSGTRVMQGKILAAGPKKNGYRMVELSAPGGVLCRAYVHHLVLAAFVGPRPEWCEEIRHLDGVKLNCRLDNLGYGTCQQNADDRKKHGQVGGGGTLPKLTPEQIEECQLLALTTSKRQLAKKFGVSHTTMNGYLS